MLDVSFPHIEMEDANILFLQMIKSTQDSIQISTGVLSTLTVNPEKMKASLEYVPIPGR
jgi:argininosuccinate lyase